MLARVDCVFRSRQEGVGATEDCEFGGDGDASMIDFDVYIHVSFFLQHFHLRNYDLSGIKTMLWPHIGKSGQPVSTTASGCVLCCTTTSDTSKAFRTGDNEEGSIR